MSKVTCKRGAQQSAFFIRWARQAGIDIEKITYAEVLEFIGYCRGRNNSQATVSAKIRMLKYYLDYMYVRPNPCRGMVISTRENPLPSPLLTKDELDELYRGYPEYSHALLRDKVVLGLLCYQAMGSREIRQLEMGDLYLDIDFIRLGKITRFQARSLRIDPLQKPLLERYIKEVRSELLTETSALLVVKSGRCAQPSDLRNFMYGLRCRLSAHHAKVKNYLQIRASVICHWLSNYNLREVQYMAGHKTITATERYLQGNVQELSRQLDKYHPLQ